jgi:pimeloyl-[acyl-carrier protein] methyl ester esterase
MAETLKIASYGQGLPLVLIHGWGLNSGVWEPCVEQLKQQCEVITVDLPGFATNSTVELTPYTLEALAENVQLAVGKPAIYLGWSLGGLIASQIALTFPQQVKGLITVASSPHFVEQENWPGIKANVLAMFHQQLAEDTTKTINNFLKIQAMGSPHLRQDIKRIRDLVMQYPMPDRNTLDVSLQLLETSDLRELLPNLQVPFLRLYGKLDGLVPKAVISTINSLVPSSESYSFEQASHAPFISHQDDFLQYISLWLRRNFS